MKLEHRLLRANIIQMVAIAVATLLGVFVTAAIMEQLLLRQALEGEAKFYWESLQKDPDHVLPHTLNMVGYLEKLPETDQIAPTPAPAPAGIVYREGKSHEHSPAMPEFLTGLPKGYHTRHMNGSNRLIHVSQKGYQKLYLIINEEQITELSFFFGVVPLMISLAGLYLLSWLTQRLFISTVSPISQLANQLETIDINKPAKLTVPAAIHYQDTEIMSLFQGTQKLLDRVQDSVAREKRFSRDASHELRTPLAVMKGSLEIILKNMNKLHAQQENKASLMHDKITQKENPLNEKTHRAINRAMRSAIEMERLIEELLLLAREDYQQVAPVRINCNQLIDEVAEELRAAFEKSPVKLKVMHLAHWSIDAPVSVLRVVLMNIASNAMRYTTEGEVVLSTWDKVFQITDTGEGFAPEFMQHAFQPFSRGHHENTKGFGLGLSIVKRFCDHYGWKIKVNSQKDQGTTFEIHLTNTGKVEAGSTDSV